jgi:hypothetical protein
VRRSELLASGVKLTYGGRVDSGRAKTRGRFVRERDAALMALVERRPMVGDRLEVEVRNDIAILWRQDVPLAARLGASMLVRGGGDSVSRSAIEEAASAEGLVLQTMGEQRLWKLLGVPG